MIDVVKLAAVATRARRLEAAGDKRSVAVWACNVAERHMPRLSGEGRVNAGHEAGEKRIPRVVRLEAVAPIEPVGAE